MPVSVPPMTGANPLPVATEALEMVPVELMTLLLPQVRAPLRSEVPVPLAPNVGFTVVVFDPLSDRHFTDVIVHVAPVSL